MSKSSAAIGGAVRGKQAPDLSLNGRSFVSGACAIDSGSGTQSDVRFAGLSDEDNNYHLDGVDNSDINHQYQKVDLHLQVSSEATAEFRADASSIVPISARLKTGITAWQRDKEHVEKGFVSGASPGS